MVAEEEEDEQEDQAKDQGKGKIEDPEVNHATEARLAYRQLLVYCSDTPLKQLLSIL